MSFAGKNLTQGGQMTAYRWRMFIQVNNWIGFWIFILFAVLTTAIFLWRIPQEALDNGSLWWFASINSSFIDLMPASGTPKIYDVHYWYAPTATAMVLKMTLPQIYTDPYMQAMGDQSARAAMGGRRQRAVQYGGVYRRDLVYREYRPKGERGRISLRHAADRQASGSE